MNIWQSVCATIVVLECAALGFCTYLIGRVCHTVKHKHG